MESFPTEDIAEITIPEGLLEGIANSPDREDELRRMKQLNRRWHTEAATGAGFSLEAAQACTLSPSEEALLEWFGSAALKSIEETGSVQPSDLSSWIRGAQDAHGFLLNFWVKDMADFDTRNGWTISGYGIEVLGALRQQYAR